MVWTSGDFWLVNFTTTKSYLPILTLWMPWIPPSQCRNPKKNSAVDTLDKTQRFIQFTLSLELNRTSSWENRRLFRKIIKSKTLISAKSMNRVFLWSKSLSWLNLSRFMMKRRDKIWWLARKYRNAKGQRRSYKNCCNHGKNVLQKIRTSS